MLVFGTMNIREYFAVPALFAFLLAFAGDSVAFWRMGCRSRTGLVRIDPLVSPGQISEHIHAIHGSSGKLLPIIPSPSFLNLIAVPILLVYDGNLIF